MEKVGNWAWGGGRLAEGVGGGGGWVVSEAG